MSTPFSSSGSTDLVRMAIAGDEMAFGKLVEKYAGMVTGVAYSILGDFGRSEDAGQEAFLEAWKKRDTLQDPAKFASWVCGIARHRALDLARNAGQAIHRGSTVEFANPASQEPTADELAATDEEKAIVWSSLDALPEKYREVMVLYYRGENSVASVAESLGEKEATVRQRLVRGRQLVREEVQRIVERTLRGTAPKAVFTAAVLGSLPGNAMAAFAGTTAAASKTAATSMGGKVVAAGTATAISGAVLGTLGGLLGGALGTWASHRNAPYASQKRLILRTSMLMLGMMLIFLVAIGVLVRKQTSDAPLQGTTYAIVLLATIFGFQAILLAVVGWMTWQYKRHAQSAEASGEPMDPSVVQRQSKLQAQELSWTSKRKWLGIPWIDIQHGRPNLDGSVSEPRQANAWIAFGDHAHGRLLAMGNRAYGLVAVGGFCVGALTMGGLGFGLLTLGGLSLGVISLGGLAIGGLAVGGISLGYHSFGGAAFGVNAFGGLAVGWNRALGGCAWSHQSAEAGLVLAGQTGEAAHADIHSHWFFQLAQQQVDNLWMQTIAIVGILVLHIFVLARIVRYRHVTLAQFETRAAARKNDAYSFYGSLLGTTAWTAGIGYHNDQVMITVGAVVLYLIALAITMLSSLHYRKESRDGPVYATALVTLNVATTLGLILAWWWGGIRYLAPIHLMTIFIITQVNYAGLAIMASVLVSPFGRKHDSFLQADTNP